MTGGSWRCGFPGWGPRGRASTCAPRAVSSETRNLDIWERELVRGWSLLLGAGATNLDDIGAVVFVCRYGRDGDSAAQA